MLEMYRSWLEELANDEETLDKPLTRREYVQDSLLLRQTIREIKMRAVAGILLGLLNTVVLVVWSLITFI